MEHLHDEMKPCSSGYIFIKVNFMAEDNIRIQIKL
jgi:hypothetical protein